MVVCSQLSCRVDLLNTVCGSKVQGGSKAGTEDDGRTAIEKLETSSDNIAHNEDILDCKGRVQIKRESLSMQHLLLIPIITFILPEPVLQCLLRNMEAQEEIDVENGLGQAYDEETDTFDILNEEKSALKLIGKQGFK